MKYKHCDVPQYMDDAFMALQSHFEGRQEFNDFYNALHSRDVKEQFLKVSSSYLFFVKKGDWHVDVQRSNPVIEYFSNSFKLIAILSLIESLSNNKHIDFYNWLIKRKNKISFPIESKDKLQTHYIDYKNDYGAISQCKDFFDGLSEQTKAEVCRLIKLESRPLESISLFVEMLYSSRSEFAHKTDISIEIGDWFHFGKYKNKRTVWKCFKLKYLLAIFEEGLFVFFNKYSDVKIYSKPLKADSVLHLIRQEMNET